MNADELKRNPVLTEHVVKDLNADARLPYEDNAFDVITNTVVLTTSPGPRRRVCGGGGFCVFSTCRARTRSSEGLMPGVSRRWETCGLTHFFRGCLQIHPLAPP